MMNELIMQITIGSGAAIALIPYIKWQVGQNTKELDEVKLKLHSNEKEDAIRDTKIAVMESNSNNILNRLEKMEALLEKVLERLTR